ncbi:MAG: hypothetical protein Q7S22_01655 [Candidatus Micrarchaeota archaeon]|nr:hypothetical protein [Candidatus Micrarchaeota archaeon]
MRQIYVMLSIMFLMSAIFAVGMIEPFKKDISNSDIVDFGDIGPGQTIVVSIDPIIKEGGRYGQGGQYDQAIATELPNGWKMKPSKLYGNPLQVEITADKNATPGDYSFKITIIDEYYGEQLNNVTFTNKVKVNWNILEVNIDSNKQTAGPGQPARYSIDIKNKGTASDVFEVKSHGIKRSEFKKYVYVPGKSNKQVIYEMTENEEGTYSPTLSVTSTASDNIKVEKNVTLSVSSGLRGDYKATNSGVIVFPIFESLISSLAGIISNFI